ncbi:MAG: hypothetical protein WC760_02885 [Bacteroidia bacterium]
MNAQQVKEVLDEIMPYPPDTLLGHQEIKQIIDVERITLLRAMSETSPENAVNRLPVLRIEVSGDPYYIINVKQNFERIRKRMGW